MAELQILDRGPGIPDGYSQRVFEEFFRADDALASGVAGAGLGLTLARRIAQDHGGDVTFKPREGGGSVFRFTLPLSPGVAQKSP
jgi:signal transduction histidine kinase